MSSTFHLQHEYLETPCTVSGTTDPEAEKAQTRGAACANHGANKITLQGCVQRALRLLTMELESLVNSFGFRLSFPGFCSLSFSFVFPVTPPPLTTSCLPCLRGLGILGAEILFCRWPNFNAPGYWLSPRIPFRRKKLRVSTLWSSSLTTRRTGVLSISGLILCHLYWTSTNQSQNKAISCYLKQFQLL